MTTIGIKSVVTTVVFAMIITCLLAGNSGAKQARRNTQSPAPVKCTRTDCRVFSAVLNAKLTDSSKTCIVQSDTIDGRPWETRKIATAQEHRKDIQPLLDELNRRNGRSCVISYLKTSRKVRLVSSKEIERIFNNGFWPAFYKKYPGSVGLVTFSLPGYSRDKNTAIVYFSHSIGGRAGYGSMIFLKRVDGRWKLDGEHPLWIS